MIVISIIPVYFANRLTQDPSGARHGGRAGRDRGGALGSATARQRLLRERRGTRTL